MRIAYKIWLEVDGKVVFGQGRKELLRAIDECRSLNSAAKKLNMSYRAAWGRLKASEERLGVRLVDVESTGMRLTAEANALLTKFEEIERETEDFVTCLGMKLFPPSDR